MAGKQKTRRAFLKSAGSAIMTATAFGSLSTNACSQPDTKRHARDKAAAEPRGPAVHLNVREVWGLG